MPPPAATPLARTALRATLSEPAPAKVSEADDSVTVASYVSDSHGTSSQTVDDLVNALDALDHSTKTGPSRASVIRGAKDATLGVHAGERVLGPKKTKAMLDAIQVPIVQSSTYTFRSTRDCIDYNMGVYSSFEYGRYGNPTSRAVEEKVAIMEGADDCLMSSSGMNAVTTMLLALVPEGGHIVTTTDCYRRTRQFVLTLLPKMGITCTVLDPADMKGLEEAFEKHNVSLYFSESPTNPMLRVVDVPAISELCKKYGAISCFDTTFCTPVNFKPMDFGADLVLHSATKYLAGHQDVMAGILAGKANYIDQVRKLHGVLGGVVDPQASYLINRGLKTLSIRMKAHNENAEAISNFLNAHPKVRLVNHPILPSHPDHVVANRLFKKGFGGMLSFEIKGDGNPWSVETFEATGRFVDHLKIPYIGPSLGGCESIVEQVCIMGYFDQPLHERRRLGINNGLVRFSCGIEDTDDLIADMEQALRFV